MLLFGINAAFLAAIINLLLHEKVDYFSSWAFVSLISSRLALTHCIVSSFSVLPCYTLFGKSNFCPNIQFWQNPNIFTNFSPKFFLTIFFVKSKLSTAKKSKTTTFSRVFHPKKIRQFSRDIKVEIFGEKMKIWNSVKNEKYGSGSQNM